MSSSGEENSQRLARLLAHIEKEIPKFELRSKHDSTLFNLLSHIMFFNKGIKDRYITTLYPFVYFPQLPLDEKLTGPAIEILAHEYVHLSDRKRLGPIFNILYLSPQIFSLFSLLALTQSNFWLLCLLFLLPIPSPARAWLEFRGYRMGCAVRFWLTGTRCDIDFVLKQFTGSSYYWMMPFKGYMRKKIDAALTDIEEGVLTTELQEIKTIL